MSLPSASSSSLHLTHPTPLEITQTHHLSSHEWAGALTRPQYIENEHQLAIHLGITHWILTPESSFPNDERLILASCERITKRCLVREGGKVRDEVVIAVAAVFCETRFRGRGYAGRMMRELGLVLRKEGECVGSVLWSDIGPKFYAGLGWMPFSSTHVELPASLSPGLSSAAARAILAKDIADLCDKDEVLLRASMAATSPSKMSFAIVPDHQTMLWHHKKEEYICEKLFGKQPDVKGAVAGEVGDRVWAIWTRGFYGAVDNPEVGNRLYVLRLVIENPDSEDDVLKVEQLKAVLQAAKNEAVEWQLAHVEIWNSDTNVKDLIERTGIEQQFVERENEGIPSLMWFGDGSGDREGVEWIASEKFAWC